MTPDLERRGRPENYSIHQPRISIADLFDGHIPQQAGMTEQAHSDYEAFSLHLVTPKVDIFSDHSDLVIAGPALTGIEMQRLFHFAAPSKTFGYDYQDTQNDWTQLYENPRHSERLKRHQTIPEWRRFEEYREVLKDFIWENYAHGRGRDDFIAPVVQVRKDREGLTWNYSPLDEEREAQFDHRSGRLKHESTQYLPVLGPVFVAAFSPELMSEFGPRMPYSMVSNGSGQDMGSTQAFALSLAISDKLVTSPFLNRLVAYAETGVISERGEEPTEGIEASDKEAGITLFPPEGIIF